MVRSVEAMQTGQQSGERAPQAPRYFCLFFFFLSDGRKKDAVTILVIRDAKRHFRIPSLHKGSVRCVCVLDIYIHIYLYKIKKARKKKKKKKVPAALSPSRGEEWRESAWTFGVGVTAQRAIVSWEIDVVTG